MTTETITWRTDLPDSDTTVLIEMPDADTPVWLGYHDGEQWLTVEGAPPEAEVTAWADMPKGGTR